MGLVAGMPGRIPGTFTPGTGGGTVNAGVSISGDFAFSKNNTDILLTHGCPLGVADRTPSGRPGGQRRPVILVALVIYTLASAGAALAPDVHMLILWRVVQGLSVGAGMVVGSGVRGA